MLIKNGMIHDAVNREAYVADILIADGKIKAIEKEIADAEGETVIDAAGKQVYPGFVEAHCHMGLAGKYGLGASASDHNERNEPITSHLRAIDAIDPFDLNFEHARKGGVTTVCAGPGSRNIIGGTFAALKTIGICVDEMAIKPEVAMKCAFGENITNAYGDKKLSSRMTLAAIFRETLTKAERYRMAVDAANGDVSKYPTYDAKLHALLPVMSGEMPLKAHAHQANDILTAIRIAKEFGVKMTLEHVTEGHLIVEQLKAFDCPMAIGPSFANASKLELRNKTWETAAVLSKAGCHVSITTDSPVVGQANLPLCAGFAVKAGMDPFEALKAITIYPAEHIGVADRVGSIAVGKDADIVICDGNPFEIATRVEYVLIDGNVVADHPEFK